MKSEVQGFDISEKKVAVIGCGGLGCNIIAHLAGAGVGTLILIDFDTVSESNLNRQFLYTRKDTGRKKCDTAKSWIRNYSPEVEAISIDMKIEKPQDLEAVSDCDILILATDNDISREAANAYCSTTGKPLVCGGIDGFYGMVFMYVPGKTPCIRCAGMIHDTYVGSFENINQQSQCIASQITSASGQLLSVSSAAGVIGSLEASLAIRFLTDGGDRYAGHLYVYDDETIVKLPVSSVEQCEFCNYS